MLGGNECSEERCVWKSTIWNRVRSFLNQDLQTMKVWVIWISWMNFRQKEQQIQRPWWERILGCWHKGRGPGLLGNSRSHMLRAWGELGQQVPLGFVALWKFRSFSCGPQACLVLPLPGCPAFSPSFSPLPTLPLGVLASFWFFTHSGLFPTSEPLHMLNPCTCCSLCLG